MNTTVDQNTHNVKWAASQLLKIIGQHRAGETRSRGEHSISGVPLALDMLIRSWLSVLGAEYTFLLDAASRLLILDIDPADGKPLARERAAAIARELLSKVGLGTVSYVGWFGPRGVQVLITPRSSDDWAKLRELHRYADDEVKAEVLTRGRFPGQSGRGGFWSGSGLLDHGQLMTALACIDHRPYDDVKVPSRKEPSPAPEAASGPAQASERRDSQPCMPAEQGAGQSVQTADYYIRMYPLSDGHRDEQIWRLANRLANDRAPLALVHEVAGRAYDENAASLSNITRERKGKAAKHTERAIMRAHISAVRLGRQDLVPPSPESVGHVKRWIERLKDVKLITSARRHDPLHNTAVVLAYCAKSREKSLSIGHVIVAQLLGVDVEEWRGSRAARAVRDNIKALVEAGYVRIYNRASKGKHGTIVEIPRRIWERVRRAAGWLVNVHRRPHRTARKVSVPHAVNRIDADEMSYLASMDDHGEQDLAMESEILDAPRMPLYDMRTGCAMSREESEQVLMARSRWDDMYSPAAEPIYPPEVIDKVDPRGVFMRYQETTFPLASAM